jgi:hypothetical protein
MLRWQQAGKAFLQVSSRTVALVVGCGNNAEGKIVPASSSAASPSLRSKVRV